MAGKKQRTWWVFARQKIVEARNRRNWSQQKLADAMAAHGHKRTGRAISYIETGSAEITIDDLELIATIFDEPLEYFLPKQAPHDVAVQQVLVLLDQLDEADLSEIRALAEIKLAAQHHPLPKEKSNRRAA